VEWVGRRRRGTAARLAYLARLLRPRDVPTALPAPSMPAAGTCFALYWMPLPCRTQH
jgi:hypothetical protein